MSIKTEDLKKRWPWGDKFLRQMRERIGPRAIVAFSSGKDAVAMSVTMKPYFDELIPFCCYYVPGLRIMDEALAYYEERLFERPIIRAPHPVLMQWLTEYRYQSPESARLIARAQLPQNYSFLNIVNSIIEDEGLESGSLYAMGARSGEFFTRAVMCSKSGGIQAQRRQWWPVWQMNRNEILDTIEGAGLAISREYELFHTSFCGLDFGFMDQLAKHEPDDYAQVKRWFPLIDAERIRFLRNSSRAGEMQHG